MPNTKKIEVKKYPVHFHNDVFFKFLLSGDDSDSDMLRICIIEAVFGFRVKKTTVLNPEILPEVFLGKRVVLDVLMQDELGHHYNIEMQLGTFHTTLRKRFQEYGHLAIRQLKSGDTYEQLMPYYQIIFMDDEPLDKDRMIYRYTMKDEKGVEEPDALAHRAYVFLPMIKEIVEKKGMENLSDFESFCYVLAFDPNDAILKLKKRMVNTAMAKYDEMRQSEELMSWAEKAQQAEYIMQASLKESMQEGKKAMLLTMLEKKYGVEEREWLETLQEEQLPILAENILIYDSFANLKKAMED